jgi:hypothetical protein
VAVLEFELRKAYETIKSLRGSLTEAATGEYCKIWKFSLFIFDGSYEN